ncbi:MAG: glycine oxidase ThiO [Polyangiaceae bacterium]|nr:glycine oxidase ThiO [Polyangiaceae bacterium]MCW5792320.1 glycine oxidase ThiO [Polyangiaceae bacterium]
MAEEVLIIGGGLLGCSAAFALAEAGAQVTVLERAVPGAEASSAAAGILGAHVEQHESDAMEKLAQLSLARYPALSETLAERTGIDVELRLHGSLRAAYADSQLRTLRRSARADRQRGREAIFLAARELRAAEPELSLSVKGAVEYPRDGRVAPRRLLRALRLAAQRAGVRFRTGANVQRVEVSGERAQGVRLADGEQLSAGWVVIAAGAWTPLIAGLSIPSASIVPARGQILQLACAEPPLRRVVFGPDCYLVPRDDGRVLVGSTLEFTGYEKRVTAGAVQELLRAAIELVPALSHAELLGHWSNFRPYTPDHAPLIGESEIQRLVFASGHYRNGILLAPITAELVKHSVLCGTPPIDLSPFAPSRESLSALPRGNALDPL